MTGEGRGKSEQNVGEGFHNVVNQRSFAVSVRVSCARESARTKDCKRQYNPALWRHFLLAWTDGRRKSLAYCASLPRFLRP